MDTGTAGVRFPIAERLDVPQGAQERGNHISSAKAGHCQHKLKSILINQQEGIALPIRGHAHLEEPLVHNPLFYDLMGAPVSHILVALQDATASTVSSVRA